METSLSALAKARSPVPSDDGSFITMSKRWLRAAWKVVTRSHHAVEGKVGPVASLERIF